MIQKNFLKELCAEFDSLGKAVELETKCLRNLVLLDYHFNIEEKVYRKK